MTSGRWLALLLLATLLSLSKERPTAGIDGQQSDEQEGEQPDSEQKIRIGHWKGPPLDEDPLNEDYDVKGGYKLKEDIKPTEDEIRANIAKNETDFDKRIYERSNPRVITNAEHEKYLYNCHPRFTSKIPAEYACDMEYNIQDYSEYDHFIENFESIVPIMTKSRIRKTEGPPCTALFHPENGRIKINCGCGLRSKGDVKTNECGYKTGEAVLAFVKLLRVPYGGAVEQELSASEKTYSWVNTAKFYLIGCFFLLVVVVILIVVACLECRNRKRSEKKRKQRIHTLSSRVESSRISLRSTCSEASSPPAHGVSVFHQLMK